MEASALWGWERFFTLIGNLVSESEQQRGTASEQYTSYVVEKLEVSMSNIRLLIGHIDNHIGAGSFDNEELAVIEAYKGNFNDLLVNLQILLQQWRAYRDEQARMDIQTAYQLPVPRSGRRGRPKYLITNEQLDYLISLEFSWNDISALLGVSRMTLYRRRQEFGLLSNAQRGITDAQLRQLLTQMRNQHPNFGETMAMGHIRSLGFHVKRVQLRNAIHQTDPIQRALRWKGGLTPRRPYSVPGPNSLWHIGMLHDYPYQCLLYYYCVDGHHKLVRWRFVTHGGIDGYSRLVVYLHCSTNNRARTVYDLFLGAIQLYGLPSRVRSDQGRENTKVAEHMLISRGIDRRSVIVGSSVHNQRIERLWRDMHRGVTVLFYSYLEYHDLLNPIDYVHLFALHYVYSPRINHALCQFKNGWNSHTIRTEHGHSPIQLFTAGMLLLQRSGHTAMDFFNQVDSNYGEDETEYEIEQNENVVIPPVNSPLSEEDFDRLQNQINPLAVSNNHGIDIYTQVINFVQSALS